MWACMSPPILSLCCLMSRPTKPGALADTPPIRSVTLHWDSSAPSLPSLRAPLIVKLMSMLRRAAVILPEARVPPRPPVNPEARSASSPESRMETSEPGLSSASWLVGPENLQ